MRKDLTLRILQMIPTLIGLSLLIFALTRIIPGDSVKLAAGTDATPEQVAELTKKMGLDQPVYKQYLLYMKGLFQGDWGYSLRTQHNVFQDIKESFSATFELCLVGMMLAVLLGVPLGVLAAVKNNKLTDHIIRILSLTGIAMPRFWLAILLQFVFCYILGILPVIGRGTLVPTQITGLWLIDSLITLNFPAFFDSLKHILIPAISLAIASAAQIMRMTRTNMLEQLNKEYIVAARSYGLPNDLVVNKYMLKNAFITIISIIGMQFGSLIGFAFLVEAVFGWPGMASYSIAGLMYKDYNAIIGVTMVIGIIFAVINLAVDLVYGLLDPRIRLGN